jgi:AraC-like DNA-binding protein
LQEILIISVILESCVILAAFIFTMLLLVTRHLPNKVQWLAIGLFVNISFIAFFYLLINVGWVHIALRLWWFFVPSTLSLALLFYYFTSSFLVKKLSLFEKALALIPFISLLLGIIAELLFWQYADTVASIKQFRINLINVTLYVVFPIYNVSLIVKAIFFIRRVERMNQKKHSNELAVDLRWSKYSIIMYTGFIIGMVLAVFVSDDFSEIIFNLSLLLLVLYIGFYEVKNITQYLKIVKEDESLVEEKVLDSNTELTREQVASNKALYQKVEAEIDAEKLYLNIDLSVALVSKKIGVNGKYISQCINEGSGKNFNNFINLKRIEYAKGLLINSQHEKLTIEGISSQSGFRSKSTFNVAFKKFEGQTPTQYIKDLTTAK